MLESRPDLIIVDDFLLRTDYFKLEERYFAHKCGDLFRFGVVFPAEYNGKYCYPNLHQSNIKLIFALYKAFGAWHHWKIALNPEQSLGDSSLYEDLWKFRNRDLHYAGTDTGRIVFNTPHFQELPRETTTR